MKKLNLIQIVFTFVLMSLCKNGYAQFTAASATENAAGVSATPRATGNDVQDYGGNTYRVSVWDDAGTSPGIAWRVKYGAPTYNGSLPFSITSNVFDADVSIVTFGSAKVFALATYYVGGATSLYYLELYYWDNPGGIWGFYSQGTTSFASGSFGTTLNIDANDAGDFVVTWDQSDTWVITGSLVTSSLVLNSSIKAAQPGTNPDVCIFHAGGGNDYVHLTYIDGSGYLTVDDHKLSDLVSGSNAHTTALNTTPYYYTFYYPRIACPNSSGSKDEWTVVAEDNDGTTFYIVGYNYKSGTGLTGPTIYNDGSQAPGKTILTFFGATTHIIGSIRPAVCYDDQYTNANGGLGIWVGWSLNNDQDPMNDYIVNDYVYSGSVHAWYPIVLQCDNQGLPVNNGSITASYWQVPTTLVGSDYVDYLSLAGRYGTDRLFLTYNDIIRNGSTVDDIYTKEVTPSSATSLRTSGSDLLYQSNNDLPIHATDLVSFKLYDLTGNVIVNKKTTVNDIQKELMLNQMKLAPSLYLLQMNTEDKKFFITKKAFIGN
jgi:hypothetical protein